MIIDRFGKPVKIQDDILAIAESERSIEWFQLLSRRGANTFLPGCSTEFNIHPIIPTLQFKKVSQKTGLWLINGNGLTNSHGVELIHLNRYICTENLCDCDGKADIRYPSGVITHKPAFIATPVDASPVLLTVMFDIAVSQYQFNPEGGWPFCDLDLAGLSLDLLDVTVKVSSWNLDGSPSPHISYTWICMAEGSRYCFS